MNLKVILIAIILVAIAFIAIGIRMFLVKGGEFKKSCGSVDPATGKPMPCVCKSEPDAEGSCLNAEEED